ncbi:hypothetical protein LCGC14_1316130 [marine sediment metagenome]|uniref:Uncharacterized protein n=1 Tax=marine sediment metagenome TaxID=412755 RepID=A0A0F9KL00_9ZZZZ
MNKDEMVKNLEELLKETQLNDREIVLSYRDTIISAMNLLADLKGYKVQFCRKSARLNLPKE